MTVEAEPRSITHLSSVSAGQEQEGKTKLRKEEGLPGPEGRKEDAIEMVLTMAAEGGETGDLM